MVPVSADPVCKYRGWNHCELLQSNFYTDDTEYSMNANTYRPASLTQFFRIGGLGLFTAILLSGCSRYQMTFNEAVVYTPPPLLTAFTTEDSALRDCLDQAIKDGSVTDAGQLQRLTCSHAGLKSLKGLETFYNLKQVNLANNALSDLEPLRYLTKLEVLLLDDNQLQSAAVLLTLPRLRQVTLSNNPVLDCADLQQLQQGSAAVTLPQQCQEAG